MTHIFILVRNVKCYILWKDKLRGSHKNREVTKIFKNGIYHIVLRKNR